MKLRLDESNIMWPGRKKDKPVGERIPTHLQVLTIEEKPFVYVRPIKRSEGDTCQKDELPCPLLKRESKSKSGYYSCFVHQE
jgi:ionotropic glutamate receptor NMDA 1